MQMRKRSLRRRKRRGNNLIEFALVAVFLLALLFGTVNLGMNLGDSMQLVECLVLYGRLLINSWFRPTPYRQL